MAVKSEDYKTLIKAVERYINSEEYPKVETICAILGIEKDQGKASENA